MQFDPTTKTLSGLGKGNQLFGMLFAADGPDPMSKAKVAGQMTAAFKKAEASHRVKLKEPQAFGPYWDPEIKSWYYAAYAEPWYWETDWRDSDAAKQIMHYKQ